MNTVSSSPPSRTPRNTQDGGSPLGAAHAVLLASGFAGLGYELLWTRMLSTFLGHEIHAVLAVVAAFFLGCSIGAWCLDPWIRRSPNPARWYAAAELIIGVWAVALALVLPRLGPAVPALIGVAPGGARQWAASFGFSFLALAPATIAMGVTLPAIERIVTARRAVGRLYASNTLGAVAGLLATTYLLVPAFGHMATSWLLAAVNASCAIGALAWLRPAASRTVPKASAKGAETIDGVRLAATVFATGLLGIGYEVLVTRVLAQVFENTVYSFASVLSVFLVGTASGAALAARVLPGLSPRATVGRLLALTSSACLVGALALPGTRAIHGTVDALAGGGYAAAILAEFAVALFVLLAPTMAMGAAFSVLAQHAVHGGFGLGRMLGANTLGAALAPGAFGVVLLPRVGSRAALVIAALGYLVLVPGWRRAGWRWALVPAGLTLGVYFGPSTTTMVTLDPGGRVLAHREGVIAAVSVVEDAERERHLKVNDRFQMGGTTSVYSDKREAHIPLLLHPAPQRALFLGIGAGVTFAAAAAHPGLQAIGVELVPEVVELLPQFEQATGDFVRMPNLTTAVADARRYVLATPEHFDVIVGDLFHPSRDGAGALYTVEHFQAVRWRLRPGGLFCQWLPLYQLDLDVLRTIARSFLAVFPEARLHLAHFSVEAPIVGLVGVNGSFPDYPADWCERRAGTGDLARALHQIRLGGTWELLGGALATSSDLAAFAGRGPLNTDDLPLVTYAAPRFVYANREPAGDRLVALIDAFGESGAALASSMPDRARLAAYLRARNDFIRAGRSIRPVSDVRVLVRASRGPLLAAVRTSADFSAAYQPLLAMAARLHEIDPEEARQLLIDLDRAQPARSEARGLLARLEGEGKASP